MVPVQIDGVHYDADEAVVKRMQEYADTMNKAINAYMALREAAIDMRGYQQQYFKFKDTRMLEKARQAEAIVDELLKKKKDKVKQAEIF